MPKRNLLVLPALIALTSTALLSGCSVDPPDAGKIGGPIKGLTSDQLQKFNEGKRLFVKDFAPEEGLGPLFNGRSCYECHGKPNVPGTESHLLGVSTVRKIGKLRERSPFAKKSADEAIQGVYEVDVDPMVTRGGPALASRSITKEFPEKFGRILVSPGQVPQQATFVSLRHAPPLLGLGLLSAVPDTAIQKTADEQAKQFGKPLGRPTFSVNAFEREPKYSRFGWKAPHPSISSFTLEAMNNEMGITSPRYPLAKSFMHPGFFPVQLKALLPKDPNDSGIMAIKLSFYLSLLAPPPRAEITPQVTAGEKVFDKLGCAVCHLPEYHSADKVFLVDPDTDAGKLSNRLAKFAATPRVPQPGDDTKYMEVKALENQPVQAYTDLLIHKMGRKLADGIPEASAGGDYWRTTPLWGLRLKKFYLHDGRTTSLNEAIEAHAGQAQSSVDAFNGLTPTDKESLLTFLRSL